MTEPTEAAVAVQEPPQVEAGEQSAPRRGRPRPNETVERDERVLTAIGEQSLTRDELATALSLSPAQTYLSLHRLRSDGKVERTRDGSQHRWRRPTADAAAAPAA
jgi:predicted Rossmann fold nucleotide-binding protein DprA/Smf involved in DNA uptake